jgi:EAL and modified HD-GYP domain-containing signal transduction protein
MTDRLKRPAEASRVCVARQPILDRDRKVFGYDLSFQALPGAAADPATADYATARVISDGLLAIGLDNLIDGRKAFVNVGRHLLLEGIPEILPPNRVVIELSADVEADADVLAACRQLREAGYSLAVDDFVLNEWTADLVPLANFLKIDFAAVDGEAQTQIAAERGAKAATLIAKKVETLDTFERASREGYTYFQGFFFGRPLILQGRDVPGHKLAHLRLLQALNDPDLSVHQLENLIKHDAALCYRILRTVNSAAFALQTTVHSIREALVLLGRDTVRRWASLWALAGLNESAHGELIVMSTTRARCCELLGASLGGEEAASEGFLVGMCSLLDAILGRPMEAILSDLPLADETRAALLGEDNPTRRLLDCAIAYERGEWDRCAEVSQRAGVKLTSLPVAFADALRWSRELQKA